MRSSKDVSHFLVNRIVRDKSGHGKSATGRVALTNWRPHQAEQASQARIQKECDLVSGTHFLETAEGSQDKERVRPSEWHSQARDRRGR